jgi:hypothetical protein
MENFKAILFIEIKASLLKTFSLGIEKQNKLNLRWINWITHLRNS